MKSAPENRTAPSEQQKAQHTPALAAIDIGTHAKALANQSSPTSPGPIDFKQLHQRMDIVSVRTLRGWVNSGKLPSIQLPGSRRRLFFWDDVQRSLRRHQTGGQTS